MLTRLKVDGFKNLVGVDIRFVAPLPVWPVLMGSVNQTYLMPFIF